MSSVIVKESPIHGKGVFAARDFKKGDTINKWNTSTILRDDELPTLLDSQQRNISYIGNDNYVVLQVPELFVNHSCEPNAFVRNACDVARRNIKKGEEITINFSLEGVEGSFACNCRTSSCRGTITGDLRALNPQLLQQETEFLPTWHKEDNIS